MDARVWQRLGAVGCCQAWKLDVHATEELMRCIEDPITAAPFTGSAAVEVFIGTCVGEVVVDRSGENVRIGIRS